ncbi:UNVERIFIED_CONTAM: hypothetical protein Slati_3873700 [Sesamum latifolium]|uniref:Retrotransposon protein, putative, Ty1-copia subclass n=1 Tax=Sesamum latifolium TaxID=2727402 RepID=A0AAW2TKW5_9LAMI
MMCACIAKERGIGRGSVHNSSPTQVLERSKKLSKDEMVLRLGDRKAVAAEAVGPLSLVGKMTKKPFVGQSAIANGLLDLVHIDVCGPLSIPARGGFSYFITFTDDHSRYGYVYLMRYKSEAFGRFKEYRLEVENQTNRKIKVLQSDRGELPPSFWGYALETATKLLNIASSKSVLQTPYEIWHGKPASYKYLRVLGLSNIRKETAGYYFYDAAEQKTFVSRNAVFLEKGFPPDNGRDEVLIEESNEEPQHHNTILFEPTVHTDSVPVLRRSTRESRVPERYGFVGLTVNWITIQRHTEKRCRTSIRISELSHEIRNGLDGFKSSLDPRRPTQRLKAHRV